MGAEAVAVVSVISLAVVAVGVVATAAFVVVRLVPYAVPILRFIAQAHTADLRRMDRDAARGPTSSPAPVSVASEEDLQASEAVVHGLRAQARLIEEMPAATPAERDARNAANVALARAVEEAQSHIARLQRAGRTMP